MKQILITLLLLEVALGITSQAADQPSTGPAPAKVENERSESDLTTVTLTPKAEERLGIKLQTVEVKEIERTRVFGGEVMLPLSGGTEGGGDDSIYSLFPNMTPTEIVTLAGLQIDADALIKKAELELSAAELNFERAETLLKSKAGTQKSVDDAKSALQLAAAALEAAKAKRQLMGEPVLQAVKKQALWVRTPVYAGDLKRLNKDADAKIGGLADRPGSPTVAATPVKVPASAGSAGTAMVDLYFSLGDAEHQYRQGQKVGVTLPLLESGESLTVPWAAVVTDINGGTWVYKKIGAQKYQRHRVQVRYVSGETAAIASGPATGTEVAVEGAAELFGTEFGVGK